MIYSSDPVGVGLATSLARPGGNVTGMTDYTPQITGKQLQLDVQPAASSVAHLVNPDNPTFVPQEQALLEAATVLARRLPRLEARTAAQIESAFQIAAARQAEGLVVFNDSLIIGQQRARIAELALEGRLPTVFPDQRAVALGGLMGYGEHR